MGIQRVALFDIRIMNADAASYFTSSIQSLFDDVGDEKEARTGSQIQKSLLYTCPGHMLNLCILNDSENIKK